MKRLLLIAGLTITATACSPTPPAQKPPEQGQSHVVAAPSPDGYDYPDVALPYQSNFIGKERMTATRRPDGGCDWQSFRPKRKLTPNAENWFWGERHNSTCQGVAYFTFIPPEYRVGAPPRKPQPGEKSDTAIKRAP